jgi:ABC-type polysaccharide/polyol phosphate transport system ATPase subunit
MSTSSAYEFGPASAAGATIRLEQVGLRFRVYGHRFPSLKEALFNRLRRRERSDRELWLYHGLDLTVPSGCRLGVIGRNGAGKSTLLKMICGIYFPRLGRVSVQGRVAPLIELSAGLNPELSGEENVLLNGALLGFSRRQMLGKLDGILDFTQLRDQRHLPVKYYSNGMLMRLAFAVASDVEPEILLLDEVFSVGDAEFVLRARDRLNKLIDHSHIVIVVSHQLDLIQRMCNRVIWIDRGQVAADGAPDQVIAAYQQSVPAQPAPAGLPPGRIRMF